ncbi:MAG: outer membrane beta-barrel protein [Saprospiraceae bacterium]|nr:MAG: hypothetical protein UZ09_BCD002002228 [Bacteroidetes bacterium OLB9]MCO6463565.1 outer membrane beta-barrel protein [Saprospiraceae bacterium]MCZ2338704.1 outer membrane beta-barrel protein [Chitinophagales bacterium]
MKHTFTIIIVFLIFKYGVSQTIQSAPEGFSLHLYGHINSAGTNSSHLEGLVEGYNPGLGIAIEAAYALRSAIEFSASYSLTSYNLKEDFDYLRNGMYGLKVKYIFNDNVSKLRPYILLGGDLSTFRASPVSITADDGSVIFDYVEVDYKGANLHLGAGLKVFLTPQFNMDFRISSLIGAYGDLFVDGERYLENDKNDYRVLCFGLGLGYYFQ